MSGTGTIHQHRYSSHFYFLLRAGISNRTQDWTRSNELEYGHIQFTKLISNPTTTWSHVTNGKYRSTCAALTMETQLIKVQYHSLQTASNTSVTANTHNTNPISGSTVWWHTTNIWLLQFNCNGIRRKRQEILNFMEKHEILIVAPQCKKSG